MELHFPRLSFCPKTQSVVLETFSEGYYLVGLEGHLEPCLSSNTSPNDLYIVLLFSFPSSSPNIQSIFVSKVSLDPHNKPCKVDRAENIEFMDKGFKAQLT